MGTCWGPWGLLPNEAGCSPHGKLWALSPFGYLGMGRGGGGSRACRGEDGSGPTGLPDCWAGLDGPTWQPGPTASCAVADQAVWAVQINC